MQSLFDLVKDIAVAVVTGAYTGLVVSQYLAFHASLQTARNKVIAMPDLMQRVLAKKDEHDATAAAMSRFLDEASYFKTTGHLSAAVTFVHLGRRVQEDIVEIWQAVQHCGRTGNIQGIGAALDDVTVIVEGCLKAIERVKPDWRVLLFGRKIGLWLRDLGIRWRRFQKYIHGEAEDF